MRRKRPFPSSSAHSAQAESRTIEKTTISFRLEIVPTSRAALTDVEFVSIGEMGLTSIEVDGSHLLAMIRAEGKGVGPSLSGCRPAYYTSLRPNQPQEILASRVDHCRALASKRAAVPREGRVSLRRIRT
jgi:hypothetical protein